VRPDGKMVGRGSFEHAVGDVLPLGKKKGLNFMQGARGALVEPE